MKPIAACSLAAFLAVSSFAPAGARADEQNVREPFSGGQFSEKTVQTGGDAGIAIGFIASDGPSCTQPNPAVNSCLVNFQRLRVDGGANYMIWMTVELNDRLVGKFRGFFQNVLDVANPFGPGIKVPCGPIGSGTDLDLGPGGRRYNFTIRAKDSAGLTATNYGTIWCPPFRGPIPNVH